MTGDRSRARTAPRAASRYGRDAARSSAEVRGHAELARGRRQLFDGPVDDARETLLLAASLLAAGAPDGAEAARLGAADAAWASGDVTACLTALEDMDTPGSAGGHATPETVTAGEPAQDHGAASTGGQATPETVMAGGPAQDHGAASTGGDGAPETVMAGGPAGGRGAASTGGDGAPATVMAGMPARGRGAASTGRDGAPDAVMAGGPAGGRGAASTGGGGDASVAARDGGGPPPPDATDLTASPAGGGQPEPPGLGPGRDPDPFFRDYRDGMRALLARRPEHAVGPLRRVLSRVRHDDPPERLLRAASAALLLGDVHAARAAGARALAVARNAECVASEARALEYLAYGELRAGRHAQARAHAEEGVRAALLAGHRNTAASHHAMLALAASIEGDTAAVTGYAAAALATARRHGLAQAATLAEWATARADLARGRPLDAADRLGPLVGPGPRRGHFAVWMLAVPCFVEAAVLAGQPEDARGPVSDLAQWADFGADPHAPAQLARCRALLAEEDREADDLYLRALALHDGSGGDFERARTELLYGRWLRRRRRLREARGRLAAALVAFERCGAGAWADQTRGELRAHGAASGKEPAAGLARLTPQQLRIARHVAEGATNREVAQRLAVSTRTVDYHLRNVFAALGVRSRIELARMVDQEHR
ncbi:LuxR C-terminal-related transcriptional regulator [Streptomyces paradoxus]|uniref:LuxR C-terminal-related transcriptional regulator n=1 Tax=Streptomyces paradoxus TaxID=66375 RepID=UPI003629B5D2